MHYHFVHPLPTFFTVENVAEALKIKRPSARVLCNRYAQKNIFIRLRRNLYMLKETFNQFYRFDLFTVSSEMFKDSYISFTAALIYHGICHGFPSIEAANTKRSWKQNLGHYHFQYFKLPEKYFFDYIQENNFKIATPEKALLDLFYLYSLGRYYVPLRHINLERIDFKKLFDLSSVYPKRTQRLLANLYARAKRKSSKVR